MAGYLDQRTFNRDLDQAGIKRDGPGGRLFFHGLRYTFINLVIESGANVKEAQDLARHSTLDLAFNVYGRSRWDRRTELVERITEGLNFEVKKITEPQRKVACLETDCNFIEKMVGTRGFEPRTPTASR